MFGKYEFAGRYEVQFVLAGLRIDTDTQCGGGGHTAGGSGGQGDSDYSEDSEDSDTPDYYEDGGEEETVQYQDTEDTEDTYSVFDEFLGQFYNEEEDEDWTPDVE